MTIFGLLVPLWWIITRIGTVQSATVEVDTTDGPLRGTAISIPNTSRQGYGFFAVPFAAPPTGNLRFAPPEPVTPWTEVRDATQLGPACSQNTTRNMFGDMMDFSKATGRTEVTSSEDCLHLNIYTPSLSGSRAVMVWIYGGSLSAGWAAQYDGRPLALMHDVVMVAIQYRLGALGFLKTEDGTVKGNMGLMDQVAALQWIHNNIAAFGGDPNRVTLFGESAGSWSVSFHLLSPKSRGLFKRVILQSGSLVGSFNIDPPQDMDAASKRLAEKIGCQTNDSANMLQCLRDETDHDIFWKTSNMGPELYVRTVTVDGEYLPANPASLLLKGLYQTQTDVLMGTTDVEGYALTLDMRVYLNPNKEILQALIYGAMPLFFPHKTAHFSNMTEAIVEQYGNNVTGDDLRRAIAELVGDLILTRDIYQTAETLAVNGDGSLYFYQFMQRPSISLKPSYMQTDHADDLYYCFGEDNTGTFNGYTGMVRTEDDRKMEDLVVGYWVNFAKTGNPNGEGLPNWPSYRDKKSYILLKTDPEVAHDFRQDRMRFWMETFPVSAGDPPIAFPEPEDPSNGSPINANTSQLILLLVFNVATINLFRQTV